MGTNRVVEEISPEELHRYHQSVLRSAVKQFVRNRAAFVGLLFMVVVVACSILAPLLAPYNPTAINLKEKLEPPTTAHLLGTDYFGRDVLARVMYGGRVSLLVSLMVVGIALMVGVPIGLT